MLSSSRTDGSLYYIDCPSYTVYTLETTLTEAQCVNAFDIDRDGDYDVVSESWWVVCAQLVCVDPCLPLILLAARTG